MENISWVQIIFLGSESCAQVLAPPCGEPAAAEGKIHKVDPKIRKLAQQFD